MTKKVYGRGETDVARLRPLEAVAEATRANAQMYLKLMGNDEYD